MLNVHVAQEQGCLSCEVGCHSDGVGGLIGLVGEMVLADNARCAPT